VYTRRAPENRRVRIQEKRIADPDLDLRDLNVEMSAGFVTLEDAVDVYCRF
jgi:hypothetical protein